MTANNAENDKQYKSVDEMVWKLSGWKFKIKWFWHRLWRLK